MFIIHCDPLIFHYSLHMVTSVAGLSYTCDGWSIGWQEWEGRDVYYLLRSPNPWLVSTVCVSVCGESSGLSYLYSVTRGCSMLGQVPCMQMLDLLLTYVLLTYTLTQAHPTFI